MPAPTLFALSSGRPPAAISVIRISGAVAFEAARRLTGKALPPPRTARLRTLRDLASGEALDKALLLLFPGPDSATGADKIGRASCRERGCQYVSISVGDVSFNKTKQTKNRHK